VIDFKFPDKGEFGRIGKKERLNLFRRYFAASSYNRLLIQKNLIESSYNESCPSDILELERSHNQDFFDKDQFWNYADIVYNEEEGATACKNN